MEHQLEHFLNLARRGKPNTCASGGELRARKLALAILEHGIGLDDEARAGAAEFLRLAPMQPQTARTLID